MDFVETITFNLPDSESFRNLAVLFQDLPIPKLVVETHYLANYLMFKDETLQRNQFLFSGEESEEIRYKNGKRNGKYIWNENGQKMIEGFYINGKREGHWTYWKDNGVIEDEGNFLNGKFDGLWISKYQNGENDIERTFLNGRYQGIVTHFRVDGTIQSQVEYLDGRFIKRII